jgi:hypothetical protein
MANRTRRWAALVAALATTLALGLAGTAFAADTADQPADSCPFGQATGDGTSVLPGAGATVFAYKFDVCRTGPKPTDVTGHFAASTPMDPLGQIPAPQGPVTCAEISDRTASFYYVLDEKSAPPQLAGTVILVHSEDGGATDKQGFTGPLPEAAFTGCAAGTPQSVAAAATGLPASGITVTAPDATS